MLRSIITQQNTTHKDPIHTAISPWKLWFIIPGDSLLTICTIPAKLARNAAIAITAVERHFGNSSIKNIFQRYATKNKKTIGKIENINTNIFMSVNLRNFANHFNIDFIKYPHLRDSFS
jgi:hypothetical protein